MRRISAWVITCIFLLGLLIGKGEPEQEHAPYGSDPSNLFHRGHEKSIQQEPCVRLFSSSGSIGCRAPDKNGQTGLLVDTKNHGYVIRPDMKFFFVAVIPGNQFNESFLSELIDSEKLKGIIVYDLEDKDYLYTYHGGKYSTDSTAPQGKNTSVGGYILFILNLLLYFVSSF